jgi:hypothetical protein
MVHALHSHPAGSELGDDRPAARGFVELGGGEQAADDKRRPRELLHGSYALGDEQLLSLTRFSASEVAGERQDAHVL